MTKAEAWKKFTNLFLGQLSERDSSGNLNEAFAHPIEGSKAEAVILSMRHAFNQVLAATNGGESIKKAQPSTAWNDDDFRE